MCTGSDAPPNRGETRSMHNRFRCAIALLAALFALPVLAAGVGYHMGPRDMVRITVYDHPDLTLETRLGSDGTINFPLIGAIRLGGKTPSEADAQIEHALSAGGFIRSPQVNLTVVQYHSQEVAVLGRVNRPGEYPLEKKSRITDALALAGGIVPDGSETIMLIRKKDGKTEYDPINAIALFQPGGGSLNKILRNGDIIYVPREAVFYIYGQVQRPGSFPLEPDMTVAQALAMGGGLTLRGTQSGIKILRQGKNGVVHTLHARLSTPVLPNDVIRVPESLF